MPGPNTPITEREKAAIFAYKYGILPDWKTAYICAADDTIKNAQNLRAFRSALSRWVNSDKVKQFSEYCTRVIADHETDARNRGKMEERRNQERGGVQEESTGGDSERPQTARQNFDARVDYYDPQNQRKQINKIIQEAADDPKTQLDAIKAIQQTQRDDRQAAKEGKAVRVYLPITCDLCPLLEKKRTKRQK
jgi:hypothetical protein